MEDHVVEENIFYFLQTTNRLTKLNMPEHSGCYRSCDGATVIMSSIISKHSKIQISLYRVSIDVPRVIQCICQGKPPFENTDPIEIFNTEQFKDFIHFLSVYPHKQDFHILEARHHIC